MANDHFTEFLHALGPAFGGPDTPLTDPLPVFAKHREALTDPSFPTRLRDFGEGVASETDVFRKTLGTQGLVWLHRWLVAASQKDPGLRAAAEAAQSVAALVESAKNRDSLNLDFFEAFMRAPDSDEQKIILQHIKLLEGPAFGEWLKGFTERSTKRSPGERKQAAAAYGHLERSLAALVPTHPGLASTLVATQDCIKALLASESDPAFGPAADALLEAVKPQIEEQMEREGEIESEEIGSDLEDLSRKGYELEAAGKLREAIRTYQTGLDAARAAGNLRAQRAFLTNLGLTFEQDGDIARSIACHEAAIEIARKLNDERLMAGSLINVADAYLAVGRRGDAYDGLRTALHTWRKFGERAQEAKALGMLGLLHQWEGDSRAAAASYQSALQCFQETGDVSGQFETLYNLGLVLQKDDRIAEAVRYYEAGLELLAGLSSSQRDRLHPELKEGRAEASVLGNLGIAYRAQGQPGKALAAAQEALRIERALAKGTTQDGVARALANLGLAQREAGKREAARNSFWEALTLLEPGSPMRRQIVEWLNETHESIVGRGSPQGGPHVLRLVLCDATYEDPLVYMVDGRRVFEPLPISEYADALKAEGWELVERSKTDDLRVALVFKRPKG